MADNLAGTTLLHGLRAGTGVLMCTPIGAFVRCDVTVADVATPRRVLELSERFDRTTRFEKREANLTWSYAAFLSAVRVRLGTVGHG